MPLLSPVAAAVDNAFESAATSLFRVLVSLSTSCCSSCRFPVVVGGGDRGVDGTGGEGVSDCVRALVRMLVSLSMS
jgi:hypothetical protein